MIKITTEDLRYIGNNYDLALYKNKLQKRLGHGNLFSSLEYKLKMYDGVSRIDGKSLWVDSESSFKEIEISSKDSHKYSKYICRRAVIYLSRPLQHQQVQQLNRLSKILSIEIWSDSMSLVISTANPQKEALIFSFDYANSLTMSLLVQFSREELNKLRCFSRWEFEYERNVVSN